ncbi:MAG TPA: hypothetical protein PLO64_06015 [Methanothermobacter sp.]|nr:putative conserved hypothetical protein [Methanothermobacter sp. MT-2]HHW05670.1 hypothetical protein [Methanothermobacter sp.]HOK73384.1 hypothetical protein [Methanothermobacter sp.]HOL69468.1 hypothetical protein [Methanothermobacter sp.]HPQ05073.1 hypothetical protein [Methanothermobacter sp.]
MLSISERAALAVEGVDENLIAKIKRKWENALDQVLNDLNFKQEIYLEYNPLIWHVSKYPIGIRVYRSIGGTITIIEFSTPNRIIPFDIFPSSESKKAVITHEIAHILDDKKWYSMDYKKIAYEARNYISREQRAELLAFFYEPLGIIHSNRSLIKVASYISKTKLKDQKILAYGILEALGRLGMNRTINVPLFFKKMSEDQKDDLSGLLRSHITYPYSFAGLLSTPMKKSVGIVKISDLIICREKLISYLKDELNQTKLDKELEKIGCITKMDEKKLIENMKKILIPEILNASSIKRVKKAKKYIKKLKSPNLKDDMQNALRLCEKFI